MKKSDNKYTPLKYLRSVTKILGTIDLDPASDEFGNSRVCADLFFSENGFNGLENEWHGNVFLNPPYSRGSIPTWTTYLVHEFNSQNIKQAISLLPNDTSTKWFKRLMQNYIACLVDHRIQFVNEFGTIIIGSPDFGNVFFYLGEHEDKFAEEFRQFGTIVKQY